MTPAGKVFGIDLADKRFDSRLDDVDETRQAERVAITRTTFIAMAVLVAGASCSSEETTPAPAPATSDAGDAGGSPPDASSSDSSSPGSDAGNDASSSTGDAGVGETCAGYGAGQTCESEQGKPFGYVCFGGPPPGVSGCKLTRESASLGNNYCCAENVCVEQIDQSAACNGVAGKPRRVQCPPTDTGNATPPAGCVEHASGSTEIEKYYCCP